MSYIRPRLDEILQNMEQELKKSGAVDNNGAVVNSAEFNRVVDVALDKYNKITAELEIQPRHDPIAKSETYAMIDWLNQVKASQSLSPYRSATDGREEKIIEQAEQKQKTKRNIFGGIKKLFGRTGMQNIPSHGRGK